MIYYFCGNESGQVLFDDEARRSWAKPGKQRTKKLRSKGDVIITNSEVWVHLPAQPRQLLGVKIQSMLGLYNEAFYKAEIDVIDEVDFKIIAVEFIGAVPITGPTNATIAFELWLQQMESSLSLSQSQNVDDDMWDKIGAIYWCNRRRDNQQLLNITSYQKRIHELAHKYESRCQCGNKANTPWLFFVREHLLPNGYKPNPETQSALKVIG